MSTAEVLEAPITDKQIATLKKWRYSDQELANLSSAEASDLMTATFREKRKLSPSDYTAAENNAAKADESSIEQRGMIIPEVMDKELDAIFGDKDEDLRPELKQLNKSMKEDLFRLGRLLVEYKKIVPYGKWYDFLKSIGVHDRQARRWMELATVKSDVAKYLPSRSDMGTDLTANGHPDTTKTKQAFKEAVKIAQTMVNEKSAANPDAEFGVALTEEEQDQAWEAGKTKVGLQTSDIGKAVEDSLEEPPFVCRWSQVRLRKRPPKERVGSRVDELAA